jgi:dolichyl-phosphate-mannose--protein O-mannosyl transferase
MRQALYSSIRGAWDQCMRHPSATAPDATVEIYKDKERQNQWRISHESLYNQYVELLSPVSNFFRYGEAELHAHDNRGLF